MKIVLAILAVLMLSSCRTENDPVQNVVLYGNKSPIPQIVNAHLELDNENYSCISFDGGNENIMFLCSKDKK